MSKTLDIIMSLKDQVSPNLGKMNANLQTTSGKLNAVGKSVSKLGGLLKTALVGGTIAKLAFDSLKAADIQAKAEKSVQRALEHTGKTAAQAQSELKDYKDFASKQQDITAFGDEGTLQVISSLISQGFGKKSIEDIVAMSQDIARSTGDEQENVTKAVAAYIKTGKGATKLAKAYKLNNDLLGKGKTESERLAEVWKAFSESTHKGASTEFLKGFEGQMVSLQARFDDLKEPVGDLINTLLGGNKDGLSGAAGGIAALADTVKRATDDIAGINERADKLGGGIIGVGAACAYAHPLATAFVTAIAGGEVLSAFASVITSVNTIKTAIAALGTAISVTTGLAMGLVGAIALLIAGATNWMSMSPEVKASMNQNQQEANGAWYHTDIMTDGKKSIFDNEANGTNYFDGGPVLVGEYGPELVNLPRGSSVNTNAQTQRELSGSGTTINCPVTIEGNVIGNESFVDQIGSVISSRVSLAIANM